MPTHHCPAPTATIVPAGRIATHRVLRKLALTAIATAMTAALLSGCVASEASRQEKRMSSRVQADTAANADVAVAFGLMSDDRSKLTRR